MSYWDFYWNFIPWVIFSPSLLAAYCTISNPMPCLIYIRCVVSLVGQDTAYFAPLFFVPFCEVPWYKIFPFKSACRKVHSCFEFI
jgi:hypothetical protein